MSKQIKLKSPAQLADFLERENPPKAKGVLVRGRRACALGWLGRISGIDDDAMEGMGNLPRHIVGSEEWVRRCIRPEPPFTRRVEAQIANLSDDESGWKPVIAFLRKLKRDGTLKRGKTL